MGSRDFGTNLAMYISELERWANGQVKYGRTAFDAEDVLRISKSFNLTEMQVRSILTQAGMQEESHAHEDNLAAEA